MNRLFASICLLAPLVLFSCGHAKHDAHGQTAQTEQTEWKEMDEFHLIMAETFHPYKDSSNLEPARLRAAELANAAGRWASATLPEKMDHTAIRSKLQQLKSEAAALAGSVRTADDNVVGEQLTKVHDTFHEIQEAWYGGQ